MQVAAAPCRSWARWLAWALAILHYVLVVYAWRLGSLRRAGCRFAAAAGGAPSGRSWPPAARPP
eukprot:4338773-Alexandrium_andersonii.AAC.1